MSAPKLISSSLDASSGKTLIPAQCNVSRNEGLPIQRLPVEIFCEIFLNCLPQNKDRALQDSFTPLLLSQICHHWRTIATDFPRLWTNIIIPEATKHNPEIVALFLERSARSPLSISLKMYDGLGDEEADFCLTQILSLLLPHSKRWRAIQFDFRIAHQLLLDLDDALPSLEAADLQLWGWSLREQAMLWDKVHRSPVLREANYGLLLSCAPSPHWTGITNLTVANPIGITAALALLPSCPSLRSVRFDHFLTPSKGGLDYVRPIPFMPASYRLPDVDDPLVLPHLHTLAIDVHGGQLPDTFLNRLSLHNLRSLELKHGQEENYPRDFDSVVQLLKRSSARLESLTYGDKYLSENEEAFVNFLRNPVMSRLKDIRISQGNLSSDAEEQLFFDMPSLESLVFTKAIPEGKGVTHVPPYSRPASSCSSVVEV